MFLSVKYLVHILKKLNNILKLTLNLTNDNLDLEKTQSCQHL